MRNHGIVTTSLLGDRARSEPKKKERAVESRRLGTARIGARLAGFIGGWLHSAITPATAALLHLCESASGMRVPVFESTPSSTASLHCDYPR